MTHVPPKAHRTTAQHCRICGKTLTNTESVNRGIGPECAAKQTQYLAAAGSSVEEIQSLILSGNPNATRFAVIALRAIGDGRVGLVERFIKAARSAGMEAV